MGDMADYTNELIEQDYIDRDAWRRHDITAEEAYDRGIIDEFGAEYGTYYPNKQQRK